MAWLERRRGDDRLPALGALARDAPFLTILALTAVLCLPFFAPLLDPERLEIWTINYFDVFFLGLVVAGLGLGQSRFSQAGERPFWRLLLTAAGLLWLVRCLHLLLPRSWLGTTTDLLTDVAYLGFYGVMLFAASLAPHREPQGATTPVQRIQTLTLVVTLAALLTYFVLIPVRIDPETYATWVPSLYLFFVLDLLLLYMFAVLRRDCRSGAWLTIYEALMVAAALWAVGDLLEALELGGRLSLRIGTPRELVWVLPGLALVAAARLRHRLPEVRFAAAGEPPAHPPARGFALVALVALPVLDYAFYRLEDPDPAMRAPRDAAVVGALLVLGLLAWLEQRHQRRERFAARAEQQRQELRLRESEARYRALVAHAPDAIVMLDPDRGRFVDANPSAEALFGLSWRELLQVGPKEVSPRRQPDGRISAEVLDATLAEVLAGRPARVEWTHLGAEGREVHCEVHLSLMPTLDRGTLVRASIVDLTERQRLEAELLQAQKMESIGRLAGGIAHDFNNLLTVIHGYAHELLAQPAVGDELRKPLSEIAGAGERAEQLTRQLLTFSRKQVLGSEALDANRVLEQMAQLMGRLLGENIHLVIELCPSPCPVRVNKGQLEQAILNLAVNAQDAMPGGGRLELATALVAGAAAGDPGFVEIRIADSGVGMDQETLARAFDPFFTTKANGKGTGLGLSTVYGFASQSGGTVEATSEPGKGTTVRLRLPRFEGPLSEFGEAPSGTAAGVADATILLVEDEDPVRELVRQVLEARGYRVLAAASTSQARGRLDAADSAIDLLLTDMVLSRGTGLEFARELRRELPELPVLLISGYADQVLSPEALAAERISSLGKPFTPDQLLLEVAEALGAEAAPRPGG